MMKEALKMVEAQYLALDTLGIVKADCFWEGFEEFWDLVAKRFPDIDFSSIKPNEGDAKAEDEQEEEVNQ